MAVRGTSKIVVGTPKGTYWDYGGRFRGGGGREGGGGGEGVAPGVLLSP